MSFNIATNSLLHAISTQKPQTMNTEKTNHENETQPDCLGAVIGCPSFGMIINNLK
jgi:hypothetical protein